jgi:hypothetical protein
MEPPWARFPTFERYTIGWRMGSGESWMASWGEFLGGLDSSYEARLAYLRAHPPAPVSWADSVYGVLHPDWEEPEDASEEEEDAAAAERRAELRALGLIASDAAYATWRARQAGLTWPWSHSDTPENAARYWTRDLWFWSRHLAEERAKPGFTPPEIPRAWSACARAVRTGEVGSLDPAAGLRSLAVSLAAGEVVPPWAIGLELADFRDSFDDDMGYVDAVRL